MTVHPMMLDSVADVLIMIINTVLAVNLHVLQDLLVLMDVGISAERPIQAASNMIYFYKGDKLWLLK
jgi:hypothetical protein